LNQHFVVQTHTHTSILGLIFVFAASEQFLQLYRSDVDGHIIGGSSMRSTA